MIKKNESLNLGIMEKSWRMIDCTIIEARNQFCQWLRNERPSMDRSHWVRFLMLLTSGDVIPPSLRPRYLTEGFSQVLYICIPTLFCQSKCHPFHGTHLWIFDGLITDCPSELVNMGHFTLMNAKNYKIFIVKRSG